MLIAISMSSQHFFQASTFLKALRLVRLFHSAALLLPASKSLQVMYQCIVSTFRGLIEVSIFASVIVFMYALVGHTYYANVLKRCHPDPNDVVTSAMSNYTVYRIYSKVECESFSALWINTDLGLKIFVACSCPY